MRMWIKWHWHIVRYLPFGGRLWDWAVRSLDAEKEKDLP